MPKMWNRRSLENGLLWAGIAAVIVYIVGDLISGLVYESYSFRDQTISELSGFGSPVRPLMVTVILTHDVLLIVSGWASFTSPIGEACAGWALC